MSSPIIKKIAIAELRIGMYVHDLNCDWLSHPFYSSRFSVRSHDEIRKIIDAGIHEIYIDVSKGINARFAPTKEEIHTRIEQDIRKIATQKPAILTRTSLSDEMVRAGKIKHQAQQQICTIMQDARLGKAIELDRVEPVVQSIADSILRNQNALTCLLRLKNKDNYTFLHSVSVCALMIAFGKSMGLDAESIHQAGIGGLLHDIGKTMVDDRILNKQGSLTGEEFDIMKTHSKMGHDILEKIPNIHTISLDIVLHHHERFDGSGYPNKLPGSDISTMAQMAAIVDVYDALTSDRVYRNGIQPADALRRIFEWSQYHFNPQLVQAFVRCVGIYPVGTLVLLESGRLAVVIETHQNSLLTPIVNVFFDTKANTYIEPRELDLANQRHAGGDQIVTHEQMGKWNVDPMRFCYLN